MIDPASALQTAVIALLRGSAAVTALAGMRVFASARDWTGPEAAVTLGPSDCVPFHRRELSASTTTLQIDCWAQANSSGRSHMKRMRELKAAVSAALHLSEPAISGWRLYSAIEVIGSRDFEDPDGVSAHGVITIRADLGPV